MKKVLSLCLTMTLAAALFVACGGSGGSSNAKVLKIRKNSALVSTAWDKTTSTSDSQVLWGNVFEGLYGMDESKGGYYKELAKDVQISPDAKVYTITLQDATFQNGDKLKASDVVFTYKRAMENKKWNYLTSQIDKVEAKDDKTFVLTLKTPYAPIIHTFLTLKVVSEKEVTAAGTAYGTVPHKAATGPYYISSYDPAAGVKLKAYEGYWKGAPQIKDVEYVFITDDSAAVIAFEKGEIDYMTGAPTAQWDSLVKASGNRNYMAKGNNIRTLNINYASKTNNGILGKQKVREAIFYAVDKATVNKAATNGYGAVAYEYMPAEYVETSPAAKDGGFKVYDYNPEKAKQLLKEAGFSDAQIKAGINIGTLTTYGAANSEKAKQVQVIQANLADVGLVCKVEVADVAIISPRLHAQDFDLCVFGDSGNYDYNNIRQQVHSESVGMDVVRYNLKGSPVNYKRVEELCALGAASPDLKKRLAYYTELWSIIQNSATIMPLIHMPVGIVWSAKVDPGAPCPTYYNIYNFKWVTK